MANEIRVNWSLTVRKGHLNYQSPQSSFAATMTGANGPSPGLVLATVQGVNVDLSLLATPRWTRIANIDAPTSTNWAEVGVYDPDLFTFLPFALLKPGESFPIPLSDEFGSERGTGAGTGTSGSGVRLRIRGIGGTVPCVVEAFDA